MGEYVSAMRTLAVLAVPMLLGSAAAAQDLETAIVARTEANKASVESQQKIDKIADQTDALLVDYRATLKQIDSLNVYNTQMRELIDAQEKELASLQEQIDRVELVGRAVAPLMQKMIASIERFVELDVPFLLDERTRRIAELKELMDRSDVTDAEKYRRIMEAYQIENEFGRTIEAYRSTIDNTGAERTVDFLRIGRIALVYMTLDGQEVGAWNQETREWVPLDSSYINPIQQGLRVARKQAAPELIRVPLPAAERAGGQG